MLHMQKGRRWRPFCMWSMWDLVLFCFAKALHFISLGGPPGPLSPSGFAPIRLYLRLLANDYLGGAGAYCYQVDSWEYGG